MTVTRDALRTGHFRRLIEQHNVGERMLSDAEITESRRRTLAAGPGGDVWVFGYGSLIWNPAIHYAERRLGRIHGWHRRFCLWTVLGRGNPDMPGLMLGLERGGACCGVVYRVAADLVDDELDIVWRREMIGGAYRPHWVQVHTGPGVVPAVTFVINHGHERYADHLDDETVIRHLAAATGPLGSNADYLFNTVRHLAELGIPDRALHRLCRRVAETMAAPPDRTC